MKEAQYLRKLGVSVGESFNFQSPDGDAALTLAVVGGTDAVSVAPISMASQPRFIVKALMAWLLMAFSKQERLGKSFSMPLPQTELDQLDSFVVTLNSHMSFDHLKHNFATFWEGFKTDSSTEEVTSAN